jgi:GTP-binding protein
MRQQTERAVAEADAAIFLIDSRAGVTPLDRHFAQWLRRTGKPIILVANKCEGRAGQSGALDAHALGLGEPIPLSAEHGEGLLSDLYDALHEHAPPRMQRRRDRQARGQKLAIVGRPTSASPRSSTGWWARNGC